MPKVLVLHFEDLPKEDIRLQQGYMVTSPLKTLIDIVESNRLSNDLASQALHDALRKGVISQEEIRDSNKNSIAIKKLMEFLK